MSEEYLTPEGLENIKKELDYLKTFKRKEIAERLKQAIAFGDLSENAAYHEAKEAQGFLEGRILELEKTLREAKIIQKGKNKDIVSLGSKIVALIGNEKVELEIVGHNEADPAAGKISDESPLGAEFLGKKKGQSGKVKIEGQETKYKILENN